MKRRTLGLVLAVIGGATAITCIILALGTLGGLYAGAMNDPLGQPDAAEQNASHAMLVYAGIGALGVVPMVIGVYLVKGSFFPRRS